MMHHLFVMLNCAVERMSVKTTATIGGTGSGVSIISAAVADPHMISGWLQVGAISIGILTGLGSFGLVVIKYVQLYRGDPRSRL